MNRFTFRLFSIVLLTAYATALLQEGQEKVKPNTNPPAPAHQAPSTPSSPGSTSVPAAQSESTVPAETPVITIDGVCDVSPTGVVKPAPRTGTAGKIDPAARVASSAAHADCKTQITRAQFEKLMKTVAPNAPPTARRQIAARYVQFLTAANEGIKLGVDKDPDFTEQLALMRLQLLAQDAERKLQTQAGNVSDADEKTFYDQNPSAFEEVTLTRIFVPRSSTETTQGQQGALDSKAIADNARQQLVTGGDPDKIQKAVFEQLKTTSEPPSTKFGAKRRGSLPPAHEQKIFSLKQGEVSEVVPDTVGFVIYRVDGKQQLPLEQVKDEVKRRLTQQRIEDARQKIQQAAKADYNDSYFGAEGAKSAPPGSSPSPSRPEPPKPGNPAPTAGASPTSQTQPANPKK